MIDIRDSGIIQTLDTIFASVLAGGLDQGSPEELEIARKKLSDISFYIGNFKSKFPMQVFQNNYAVFYEFIMKQNSYVFQTSSFRTALESNFDDILESPYIDMSPYNTTINNGATTRDEKFIVFYEQILEHYRRLSHRVVTKPEFESACNLYVSWFKEQYMSETYNNMALITGPQGFEYRKSHRRTQLLKGYLDAEKYYRERKAVILSLEKESSIKHTVYNSEAYQEEMQETSAGEAILNYNLPVIDDVKGSMRRGNMIEVMGPPKGGKTTLTTFFVENAISKGLNVAVWALEGTPDEWKSLIIALMVRKKTNLVVDKKNVLERNYKSDQEKSACEAARAELAVAGEIPKELMQNPKLKRGALSFIEGAAYVEDFIEVLKYHYENVNPFDVIVMDSPINILSRTGKPKVERISECYMTLKSYVANSMKVPAIAIVTAQIKQTAVDYLRQHPGEDLDVTSGGESAETIRTPDEVIGVFSTKRERETNRMQIQSVASRHNRDFPNSYIGCQLGCGYFWCDDGLNE